MSETDDYDPDDVEYYLGAADEEFNIGDEVIWTPEGRVSHIPPNADGHYRLGRTYRVVDINRQRVGVVR